MTPFFFRMLGPFAAARGGEPVPLPRSRKARALLAYLAAERRPQRKEHLVELFFADTQDPKGGLRWSVSRLRAALGKATILSDNVSVSLDRALIGCDLDDLDEPPADSVAITELDALERRIAGEFLADLSIPKIAEFEAWRLARQVDCNNRHAALLKLIVAKSLGTSKAVDSARKLVNLDVTREGSWALLIKALLAMNQLTDARHIQRLATEQLERDGVRLTGKLEQIWRAQGAGNAGTGSEPAAAPGGDLGLKPRVAVLSCRPAQRNGQRLAERLTETVFRACNVSKTITALAPAMSAELDSAGDRLMGAAKDMGVDLLMQSALSRRKGDHHVEVELIDTVTGGCVFRWSRSFAGTSNEELPEALEAYLAARMEIDFPIALISRVREKPREELTARDQYLLALPRMFSADGFDPVGAYELLENALSRQPYFGQACCALSLIRMFMPQCNDNEEQLEITLSLARRSVEICQDDAFVLGIAAVTIGHIASDTDTGLDLVNRALSVNPYSVMARVSAAMINHYRGDDAACLNFIDSVEANSDTEPVSFFCHTCRAMAYYQLRDYAEALKWSKKAVGHNPKFVIALRYLLASLAQLGLADEAAELAQRMIALDPSENVAFFERRSAYDDAERTAHLCDGLRKAGLPDSA